eukprot:444530-Prorocentrum_minimum.AAC.1
MAPPAAVPVAAAAPAPQAPPAYTKPSKALKEYNVEEVRIFSLPSRDWCPLRACSLSPSAIGWPVRW